MNATDLRKAAILVSMLDTASADVLLDQMGPTAQRVRAAVMDLDNVTEAEQAQVIQEFLGRGSSGSPKEFGPTSEVTWELPDPANLPATAQPAPTENNVQPFAFLSETEPHSISEQLQRENPQLAAVVLAHLPAEQAAAVLHRLPTALATDVLVRIAHLDEMVPEVLADIEQQLRTAMAPVLRSRQSREHGAARVGAILQSLPTSSRGLLEDAIVKRDRYLLGSKGTESTARPELRIAPESMREEEDYVERATKRHSPPNRTARSVQSSLRVYPPSITAPPFTELATLSDADWQKLLESADADLILLAFAGAEPKLINRLLRSFPKKEADYWRKQFAHPGPVRVRDIDDAQERLAQLAAELTDEGILHWPARNRLSAVA